MGLVNRSRTDVAAVRGRLDVADDSYSADRSPSLATIELAAVSALSNDAPTLTLDKPSHSPEPCVKHVVKPRRHCSVACVHTSRHLVRTPRGRATATAICVDSHSGFVTPCVPFTVSLERLDAVAWPQERRASIAE